MGGEVQVIAGAPSTLTCTAYKAKPAARIEWFLESANKTYAAEENVVEGDEGLKNTISDLNWTFISDYCKKTVTCVADHPETSTQLSAMVSLDVLGKFYDLTLSKRFFSISQRPHVTEENVVKVDITFGKFHKF